MTHHPSAELLVAYASGAVPDGVELVIACHLERCPLCRAEVAAAEAVGGVMLDEAPAVPLSVDFDALLARVVVAPPAPARPPPAPDPVFPAPLVRRLSTTMSAPFVGVSGLPWRFVVPGARRVSLPVGPGPRATLWLFGGGFRPPRHTHPGDELTLVISGGYRDRHGAFGPGDVEERAAEDAHEQRMDDEGCVALIVDEGPIVPTTWFGKLLARLASG
jgi:putative transcriptional regulator